MPDRRCNDSPMSDKPNLDADTDSMLEETHLLEDLDSYLDDINSRLTISRMVGDSIIKGMVNAIAEESTKAVSSKDAEIDALNKRLKFYELGAPEDGLITLSVASEERIRSLKGEIRRMRANQVTSLESLSKMERDIDDLGGMMSNVFRAYDEESCRGEIEREINACIIGELMEGCERRLLQEKSIFEENYEHWVKRVAEISDLVRELESVAKSVVGVELESNHYLFQEVSNRESASQFEIAAPDELSLTTLSHLSREELVEYYKTEINQIKRQLEASLHEKTEELFRVKRRFLKEKARLLDKREKEMEGLKRKLPSICLSLDGILHEARQISSFHEGNNFFEEKIERLLSENKSLHDLLAREREEVNRLIEDERIEAFLRSQVDRCVLGELIHDACIKNDTVEKVNFTLFHGFLREAQSAMSSSMLCMHEEEERLRRELESFNCSVREKDEALSLSAKNLEKLRGELSREVASLESVVDEKGVLVLDLESKLRRQKDELHELEKSLRGSKAESEFLKCRLEETKRVIIDLDHKLKVASKKMEESEEEKLYFFEIIEEREKRLSIYAEQVKGSISRSVEGFERVMLQKLERLSSRVLGLSCECNELSCSVSLLQKRALQHKNEFEIRSNDLRREIRIILRNHEMAENEVDRLGDEVDDLMNVLEKVYIALDHYSPVLQHYVGVMEIMEMIKRKLKEMHSEH